MNCKNYVDIEFSTYLFVRSWMNITTEDIKTLKLSISVNSDNLKVSQVIEPYGKSVEVPNPCDETKTITVDNIMLNTAKLDGYIGYYIGAEVINPSTSIVIGYNNNPVQFSNFITASDICYINNLDFLLLDPDEEIPSELEVTILESNIDNFSHNESHDYVYNINGKFRITRKI